MPNAHGDFVWYELMTPDPAAAGAFYRKVAGLDVATEGSPVLNGSKYYMITAPDGTPSGGVLTLTPQMAQHGSRPCWLGYVAAEDVDATVAQAIDAGGRVLMGPIDHEGVGRMALLADPVGVPFYVMRGSSDEKSTVFQTMTPGHVAWNELMTPTPGAAREFYYGLFNWTDGEAMEMGELGTYQMFDQNGQSIGAMMKLPGEDTPPGWLFYLAVPDIDAATNAIAPAGGRVLNGPQPIPGDMFCTTAMDPQGAAFALVGPRHAG